MDAEKIASHPSPKHEPKKMTSHGKKGWTSKSNIKEDAKVKQSKPAYSQDRQEHSMGSGKALGPNPELRKGPNDDLLLTDYVTWNGPDPDIRKGPANLAKGSKKTLGSGSNLAKGPDASNQKGPRGLAMGSIFLQKKANIHESSSTRTR